MVSFRYHLVTIVAVFLALALGILMGTTVVKQGVVDQLKQRTDRATTDANNLRKDVNDLRQQLATWNDFARAAEPLLVSGQLTGQTVVLVAADGVELSEVNGVRNALASAGADVSAVLLATSRMGLQDQSVRAQLATVVGLPDTTDPADLAKAAVEALAARLIQGPPSASGSLDVLEQLAGAKLLLIRENPQGLAHVGGAGQPVVVLSGGKGPPVPDPQSFFVPMVETLVKAAQPVVAGETLDSAYPFVSLLRRDGAVDGQAVTVDDADQMSGRVALVLGLRRLLDAGIAGCGDFGVKPDACAILPSPGPSP
jgi:hypothetical protein